VFPLHVTTSLNPTHALLGLFMRIPTKIGICPGKRSYPVSSQKYSQVSLPMKPPASKRASAQLFLANDDECASINDFSDEGGNEMWVSSRSLICVPYQSSAEPLLQSAIAWNAWLPFSRFVVGVKMRKEIQDIHHSP
jgi:hypothetical protein